MPRLDCTHESPDITKRVCAHLLEKQDQEYYRVFTGQGNLYDLACEACGKESVGAAIPF